MRKETVWPGGARQRGVPVITNLELLGQEIEYGQLVWAVAFHHFSRIVLTTTSRIRSHVSAVHYRRIRASERIDGIRPAQLLENPGRNPIGEITTKLVAWVKRHCIVGALH